MGKANHIRNSFNGGEISPFIEGRIDFQKYPASCKYMAGFYPMVEGAVMSRAGTRFVKPVKNENERTWLYEFKFNVSQNFILEFGHQYIRFYRNHGAVLEASKFIIGVTHGNPTIITSPVHGYNNGDEVFLSVANIPQLNGYFPISNVNANSFEINADSTLYPPFIGGGTVARTYEIASPYASADLTTTDNAFALRIKQSADALYIAHPNYPLYKLSRLGNTNWTIAPVNLIEGPFEDQNLDKAITVYSSAATGTVTLTASSGIFTATDVGGQFFLEMDDYSSIKPWEAGAEIAIGNFTPLGQVRRSDNKIYECTTTGSPGFNGGTALIWRTGGVKPTHIEGIESDGDGNGFSGTNVTRQGLDWEFIGTGYGYLEITSYISPTQVQAVVKSDWELPPQVVGAPNATYRWSFGAFSETRGYATHVEVFRGRLVLAKQQTLYFSVAGALETFSARIYGQVTADAAIVAPIQATEFNAIQWLSAGSALLIGTANEEFIFKEETVSQPLSVENKRIEQQTSHGGRNIVPARIGNIALFVQKTGRRLREIFYTYESEGYVTADANQIAAHITQSGIIDMRYQEEPYGLLWALRDDGQLITLTFNKEQQVRAWARQPTDGRVESIAVATHPDNSQDEVWQIVNRTINGVERRYVEYYEKEVEDTTDVEDCFYLDSGLTYDNTPIDFLQGLEHLEGKTVSVLADGCVHPPVVVANGGIILQRKASKIHVGLPIPAILITSRIEAGAAGGSAQTRTKRIHKVWLRLWQSIGGKVGTETAFTGGGGTFNKQDHLYMRGSSFNMNEQIPFFNGDIDILPPNDFNTDGYVVISQEMPLPLNVIMMISEVSTFE